MASTPITEAANDETMGLEEAASFMRLGYKAMKELVDTGAVAALSHNQKHCVLLKEDLREYIHQEGRRQATERRQKHQQTTLPNQPTSPLRSAKKALPNLASYEITRVV